MDGWMHVLRYARTSVEFAYITVKIIRLTVQWMFR